MDQTDAQDPVWLRVDAWLKDNRKTWKWLGEQLGDFDTGRMGNWNRRGVPAKLHRPIALALNESTDWLLGLAPARGQDPYTLTAMALRIRQEFDAVKDDSKQLDLYTQIIGLIARARGT